MKNSRQTTQIIEALSPQRLAAFRKKVQDSEQQLLQGYIWNITLSEALYPPLHFLEVVLRNHVHALFASHLESPTWLKDSSILEPREAGIVKATIDTLKKQQKIPDEGNIIAELNFGFWTSLFDVRYERILWQKKIAHTFPFMPRRQRTRQTISVRLNSIRRLRNRVFHYEPIWHWNDLIQQHSAITETIGWMSPDAKELLREFDRLLVTLSKS